MQQEIADARLKVALGGAVHSVLRNRDGLFVLAVVPGEQLIRALSKFGYVAVRQKGSHVRLQQPSDVQRQAVTIPCTMKLRSGHYEESCETRESRSNNLSRFSE